MLKRSKSVFLTGIILVVIACTAEKSMVGPRFKWERLVIEGEGVVYSIYGSIEKSMLAGTLSNVVRSEDGGKTWQQVLAVQSPVGEFRTSGDTLLAITNFADYYSLDRGLTWSQHEIDLLTTHKDSIRSSSGNWYKIKQSQSGELANPSQVLESADGGKSWKNIFPYQHLIYTIYLDSSDRLYIGTNNWPWNEEKKSFEQVAEKDAIIYYTLK